MFCLRTPKNCYALLKCLLRTLKTYWIFITIFQWLKAPLHHATENEHLNIAKYLIEQGALINVKNEVRGTLLSFHSSGETHVLCWYTAPVVVFLPINK